jgi:hypothetical protein
MCTLTFIPVPVPKTRGFLLGMNRDDRYSRPPALAPAVYQCGSQQALYPVEPGSGTWIAVNQASLAFAILNWSLSQGDKVHSRGEIIPRLAACTGLEAVARELSIMNLAGTLPFRLIAISANEQEIREHLWNGSVLQVKPQPWKLTHWFSSGRGDDLAERSRRPICEAADAHPAAGSVEWLRSLHQSHAPERGSFSICVHREDAGTLSYTEVHCDAERISIAYSAGYPCESTKITALELPRLIR